VFIKYSVLIGSYNAHGAQAIEVLLANRAFVVKRVGLISGQDDSGAPPADRKSGQVTWSKYKTTGAAWEIAKQRANFV